VPVLARTLEAADLSTIMITTMPYWAEKIGVPRALAVEFPFAQTLGRPHDQAQQRRVICQALAILESAEEPGTIAHSVETWPIPLKEAIESWQPEKPSPVVAEMAPRMRGFLRERRRQAKAGKNEMGGLL
jgi:hypothetical protein